MGDRGALTEAEPDALMQTAIAAVQALDEVPCTEEEL